ncbi:MAG: hypothetical protein GY737_30625 [Desulfobacteraceae bacterium]|nr:hypothetical protein [Desulfobacteraceae bacterium]
MIKKKVKLSPTMEAVEQKTVKRRIAMQRTRRRIKMKKRHRKKSGHIRGVSMGYPTWVSHACVGFARIPRNRWIPRYPT